MVMLKNNKKTFSIKMMAYVEMSKPKKYVNKVGIAAGTKLNKSFPYNPTSKYTSVKSKRQSSYVLM